MSKPHVGGVMLQCIFMKFLLAPKVILLQTVPYSQA